MANRNCIVGEPFCGGMFGLCDVCKAELQHRRELERIRARACAAQGNETATERPHVPFGLGSALSALGIGIYIAARGSKK